MTTVTVRDCFDVGICLAGQRRFCRHYGIDFRSFVKDGLTEEQVQDISDAHLARAMEQARKREASQ